MKIEKSSPKLANSNINQIEEISKKSKHYIFRLKKILKMPKYLLWLLYCEYQGMYKNRVKNDIKNFEIPVLVSCKRGNPNLGKIQNKMYILNFFHSVFC